MATFAWTLQGGTPTTIGATDKIKFAGAAFASPILYNTYQDSTHVSSSVGADVSTGNTPKNSKFISQTGGTGGDSQVDVGAGTVDLDSVTTANCPLKINFSDASSVATSSAKFYSYNGTTPATAPPEVGVKAAEQGDANWTNTGGAGSAVSLSDQAAATSHDFFLLVSATPAVVGTHTAFAFRIELIYS